MRRILALLLLPLALPAAAADETAVPPQAVSAAERAAVELALVYAQGGGKAWWPRLSPDSPLRELGEAGAVLELESRLGAAGSASWELQTLLGAHPPGLAAFRLQLEGGGDDLVVLELEEVAGGAAAGRASWALDRVVHWSDPLERPPAPTDPARVGAEEPSSPSAGRRLLGLNGVLLALILALAALVLGRSRPRLALASLAGALLSAVVGILAVTVGSGGAAPRAEAPAKEASGSSAADRARLKKAQHELQAGNIAAAQSLLAELPNPSPAPLAEVLRARLALLDGDEVDTVLFYQRAIDALPAVDGLLLEKVQALALSGFEDRAKDALIELAAGGSRSSEVHYLLAREALSNGDETRAKTRLRQAWELAPIERGDLLADPYFAYLVVTGDLFQRLRLGRPQEPTVGSPDLGAEAIALPPGFAASVSGRQLRFARGRLAVTVPGGSALAPAGTLVEDAATRRIREEAEALAGLGALKMAARAPTAMAQPALRQRVEATSIALYRKQRWIDLVELTQSVAANPERLPTSVMHLRAEALARTIGPEEATRFMLLVAKSQAVARRRDPYALLRLARHLKDAEHFELAAQVASRAEAQMPEPPASSMLPLIHMERRLATAYQVHETRNFRLRYPSEEGTYGAIAFGRLLERELVRLRRWIPFAGGERIGIDLFPFQDFMTHYSMGGHAIGLFDGKVRVPFAQARGFNTFIVQVLSHEVAHAMIAEVTDDRAPDWFQEGLAQHIEMTEHEVNPIGDLRQSGKLLAFPLLEPIFNSRVQQNLVTLAYSQAAWALHAIEGRHGIGGIHRLLAAFKRGLDTEEAIRAAFGLSIAEFDQQIWDWCEHRGPAVWSRPVIRYTLGE